MQLTDQQLKQYQDEGYVFLGKVLTNEQLEGLPEDEGYEPVEPVNQSQ